jgi:hypothetical protein
MDFRLAVKPRMDFAVLLDKMNLYNDLLPAITRCLGEPKQPAKNVKKASV